MPNSSQLFRNPETSPFIHHTLLDTDLYQFLMLQFLYYRFEKDFDTGNKIETTMPSIEYGLTHRKVAGVKTPLATVIDIQELEKQLQNIAQLRFTPEDLAYLASLQNQSQQPIFSQDFLYWLQDLTLAPISVQITPEGDLDIQAVGAWHQALLWETFVMSTITELVSLAKLSDPQDRMRAEEIGLTNLNQKMAAIANHPEIFVAEFGTRRRSSLQMQRQLMNSFIHHQANSSNPRPIKTSNVALAREFHEKGASPMGTMAHQLFMVMAALHRELDDDAGYLQSQQEVVKQWFKLYGYDLSIWLPDTFTSDAFFADADPEIIKQSKGFRHDSGDPHVFAQKLQNYLRSIGLSDQEIKQKMLIFSDSLTIDLALELHETWNTIFSVSFGIGTHLTNDLGEYTDSPSIVFKPHSLLLGADGSERAPILKLSDDLAKVTGDQAALERLKVLVGNG